MGEFGSRIAHTSGKCEEMSGGELREIREGQIMKAFTY